MAPNIDLTEILRAAIQHEASDVVLKDGKPPMLRVRGELVALEGAASLTADSLEAVANTLLPDDALRLRFATERQADFAFGQPAVGRFRVNLFRQRGGVGMAFRLIPPRVRSVTELNLPPVIVQLAEERRGLILVTGATGSGKTTTLAAMIDHINQTRARHIITIEDPIEYEHQELCSIISQREIGTDVNDFPSALHSAMRQNPDVIMVGEMRSLETMETAIMAAETGHLVMSTLHTADAPETIMRTVAAFPEHRREQIQLVLASVLRGVVSQRLVRSADGTELVPAVEVLVTTLRAREYIEKQRIRELPELIAQGRSYGMQTFDQSIGDLFRAGRITHEEALANCRNPADFELYARGLDSGAALSSIEPHSSAA